MTLYEHVVHPHIAHRSAHGPIKVKDQLDTSNAVARFNTKFALMITQVVGSMWCAYAFAILDFVSLPSAIKGGTATLIQWIAQTFLQLVLLSIIMVGQNVQAEAADKRSEATYKDAEALLHGQEQVAEHLAVQDRIIAAIARKLEIDVELVAMTVATLTVAAVEEAVAEAVAQTEAKQQAETQKHAAESGASAAEAAAAAAAPAAAAAAPAESATAAEPAAAEPGGEAAAEGAAEAASPAPEEG
jgi:hypothetical protein